MALGEKQSWNYRGQIIPDNHQVTLEAVVTTVDDDARIIRANGFLTVDRRVIYQMTDFTVRLILP